MTAALTPEQAAFIALADHGLTCPGCRPEWIGDDVVHRPCAMADELYRVWSRLWNAAGRPVRPVGR